MKIIVSGQNGKKLVETEVDQFPLTIGRSTPAQMIIPESDVSRQHLEINWDGQLLSVRDLKSRNGIYVGGKRIESGSYSLPCTIQIGTSIRMELTADPEETIAEAVPRPPKRFEAEPPPIPISPPRPIARAKPKVREEVAETPQVNASYAESLWRGVNGVKNHWVFTGALVLGVVYGLFRMVVMRDDPYAAMIAAIAAPLGLVLVGVLSAAVLALPGWLIRGSYDLKPMIIGFSLAGAVYLFAGELTMFVFTPMIGLFVKILIIAAIVFSSFSSWISFLLTTFPSRWGRVLLRGAVVMAVLSTFGASKALVFISRQELLSKLFSLQSGAVVRSIGGPVVTPGDLANDLRRFTPENN